MNKVLIRKSLIHLYTAIGFAVLSMIFYSPLLDGKKLYFAYQPVKKQLSYHFERPISLGDHELIINVFDKVGNKKQKKIYSAECTN